MASTPKPPPMPKSIRFLFGGLAGMGATIFVQPLDLIKNRMQLSGEGGKAREHKTSLHAIRSIIKSEGLFGMYAGMAQSLERGHSNHVFWIIQMGCVPTIGRAMVVNAAQLASYSQAKQMLMSSGYFQDNIMCHFAASMISGLITTAASMPVDIAKTRVEDVLTKVIRSEGFFSLWKGFTPYYARLGPHTVLTFIFLEQMNQMYRFYVLGDTSKTGGGL
ncbi:mitochondrial 2-oxoglutarate/malate carrier protein-like [Centruroides sculpturatus]|uniref:mitochondrial 2-oxoglutarate/malate carrier protein-like n=1 Tax=Centruroides sculpturatus TaxID=218467 RepID=UPI000C6DB8E9|nr:mitochondrial 2-oxoglutarate/malate carrier protein-like [Centruroides sculpturatus]